MKDDKLLINEARAIVEKCLNKSIDKTRARYELNKLLERLGV